MTALTQDVTVGVIGAGTMGAGIAQVAASAGHSVLLFDAAADAAEAGRVRLAKSLATLVEKGRMDAGKAEALIDRIKVVATLQELASAGLVIEAIVERLDIKRSVFTQLEQILPETAILATNTSSISVTSIGAGLKRPGQLVGMHFFNPAPVMKLVEVVAGVATCREVTETIFDTATAWGKVAVHTKSTPGFIVNRVARAFYAEPMRLLEEGVASPDILDGLFRKGGGFRMGPFELMDLIGNDVNFAVSQSVFEAFFYEPRFRPSLLQQELVNAGHLGRKSGKGWYDYSSQAEANNGVVETSAASAWQALSLGGEEERDGLIIALTDGRRAATRSAESGRPVILHDLVANKDADAHVGFAASPEVTEEQKQNFVATVTAQGFRAIELPDWPGLVVLRTLALIANEGFEAVQQGIGTEEGVDSAMVYGVNYPKGPIVWARAIGLSRIYSVLSNLQAATGDMRYRPSLRLKLLAEG